MQSYPAIQNEAPLSIAVGDFNGDGKLDFVVANGLSFNAAGVTGDTVSVYLNQGAGTFAPATTFSTGIAPTGISVSDLNHDGILDLAVANSGQVDENFPPGSDTVSVLLGNGDGTFGPQSTYVVDETPVSLVAADVNGDGIPDLAVAIGGQFVDGLDGGFVSVLLNNGDGTFAAQTSYAVGGGAVALTAGDFNGDCQPDLAVANFFDGTVSILLNVGGGRFSSQMTYPTGLSPSAVVAKDVNGDGILDLALVTSDSSQNGDVAILLGRGDGTFRPVVSTPVGAPTFPGGALETIVAADFSGHGFVDLAVGNHNGGWVTVLLNDGTGNFSHTDVAQAGPILLSVAAGDFDGDGRPDVVYTTSDSNGDGTAGLLLSSCQR